MKRFGLGKEDFLAMIVIVIIMISVFVPLFFNSAGEARELSCHDNMRATNAAVFQFEARYGSFKALADIESMWSNLVCSVMESVKSCPAGGEYEYNSGPPPYLTCTIHGSYD